MKKSIDSPNVFWGKDRSKDKLLCTTHLREVVLEKLGLTFEELKANYSESKIFQLALMHVITTKKALCEAFEIPVEAGCRRKRELEERGILVQSLEEVICPYTGHKAHLLSTNPKEFKRLKKSNQLDISPFDGYKNSD